MWKLLPASLTRWWRLKGHLVVVADELYELLELTKVFVAHNWNFDYSLSNITWPNPVMILIAGNLHGQAWQATLPGLQGYGLGKFCRNWE